MNNLFFVIAYLYFDPVWYLIRTAEGECEARAWFNLKLWLKIFLTL